MPLYLLAVHRNAAPCFHPTPQDMHSTQDMSWSNGQQTPPPLWIQPDSPMFSYFNTTTPYWDTTTCSQASSVLQLQCGDQSDAVLFKTTNPNSTVTLLNVSFNPRSSIWVFAAVDKPSLSTCTVTAILGSEKQNINLSIPSNVMSQGQNSLNPLGFPNNSTQIVLTIPEVMTNFTLNNFSCGDDATLYFGGLLYKRNKNSRPAVVSNIQPQPPGNWSTTCISDINGHSGTCNSTTTAGSLQLSFDGDDIVIYGNLIDGNVSVAHNGSIIRTLSSTPNPSTPNHPSPSVLFFYSFPPSDGTHPNLNLTFTPNPMSNDSRFEVSFFSNPTSLMNSSSNPSSNPSTMTSNNGGNGEFSKGAIASIAVGGFIGLVLLLIFILLLRWYLRKRHQHRAERDDWLTQRIGPTFTERRGSTRPTTAYGAASTMGGSAPIMRKVGRDESSGSSNLDHSVTFHIRGPDSKDLTHGAAQEDDYYHPRGNTPTSIHQEIPSEVSRGYYEPLMSRLGRCDTGSSRPSSADSLYHVEFPRSLPPVEKDHLVPGPLRVGRERIDSGFIGAAI